MSGQYTIGAVSDHTVDDGDYRIYYVKLDGANPIGPSGEQLQAFELVQKRASNAPKAGQTIEVKTFAPGSRDGKPTTKIVKDWDAIRARQSAGGSSRSSGGGGDDARGESIERQVAAKVAGEMAAALVGNANATPNPTFVSTNFEEFFDAVLSKIKGTPAQTLNGGGGEVPADTRDMVPAATASTADESLPF